MGETCLQIRFQSRWQGSLLVQREQTTVADDALGLETNPGGGGSSEVPPLLKGSAEGENKRHTTLLVFPRVGVSWAYLVLNVLMCLSSNFFFVVHVKL